jgi:hypothetical protein
MEAIAILVPLVISLGNCVVTACLNKRVNNRIQKLEYSLTNLINRQVGQYSPVTLQTYTQPPPPSAPPGYGYQHNSGDPTIQGLNVV